MVIRPRTRTKRKGIPIRRMLAEKVSGRMERNGNPDCIICDIDGTICDSSHRKWNEGHLSGRDRLIQHVVPILKSGTHIVFLTMRHEEDRIITKNWLDRFFSGYTLMMRGERGGPDHEVKKERLDKEVLKSWYPVLAIDDKDSVIRMWNSVGIPTIKINEPCQ